MSGVLIESARDALIAAMADTGERGNASDADLRLIQAFALMHIGDQLARIADVLAAAPSLRGGEAA